MQLDWLRKLLAALTLASAKVEQQRGTEIKGGGASQSGNDGGTPVEREGLARDLSDSFVSLRIRLTTNFSQLSSVRVITNSMKEQIDALRRAELGIDTAANIETRPEIKPEIVDVVPSEQPKPTKGNRQPVKEPTPESTPSVPTEQPAQPVEPENTGGEKP